MDDSITGWTGKVLEIDLSRRTHRLIRPDRNRYYKFVGGKGLAGTYVSPYITLDYRDPDMPRKPNPAAIEEAKHSPDYVTVCLPYQVLQRLAQPPEPGLQLQVHGWLESNDYEQPLSDFLDRARHGDRVTVSGTDPNRVVAKRVATRVVAKRVVVSPRSAAAQ